MRRDAAMRNAVALAALRKGDKPPDGSARDSRGLLEDSEWDAVWGVAFRSLRCGVSKNKSKKR